MNRSKIVVLSGAGMSAESGLKTFREEDGLWEGHDVMKVASPEGWASDIDLVIDFYNQRRQQLLEAKPNIGHTTLGQLESDFDVSVVTQNVDDLHERGGSSKVMHLHGELFKVRSTKHPELIYEWRKDLKKGDVCERGAQLRPHIVWFGEDVPMLPRAAIEVSMADIVIIVGTSMQVYPAASLVRYARSDSRIYYVDPNPSINYELQSARNLKIIAEPASTGLLKVIELIKT